MSYSSRKRYTSRRERMQKSGKNFKLIVYFGLLALAVYVIKERVAIYDYLRYLFN